MDGLDLEKLANWKKICELILDKLPKRKKYFFNLILNLK